MKEKLLKVIFCASLFCISSHCVSAASKSEVCSKVAEVMVGTNQSILEIAQSLTVMKMVGSAEEKSRAGIAFAGVKEAQADFIVGLEEIVALCGAPE